MKKYYKAILGLFIVCLSVTTYAQDSNELQENAKNFMRDGDFTNAILVLNRAKQMDPKNIEIVKSLALNYYFKKDYKQGLETIKPVLDWDQVDDQCFQIAGNLYQALDLPKDCEKLYRKALKKFPDCGPLYNDLGELMVFLQEKDFIAEWEKGIEKDPTYSKNYLNACRYYAAVDNKIWSILYGEIFLNMEPFGTNSSEIKSLVLELYKRIFQVPDIEKANKEKSKFAIAFVHQLSKQSNVAALGISPESLTMIRTRFILDWFSDKETSAKFPFRLFDYQRQLIQQGYFDAYNQWIFGTAQNLVEYQTWTNLHAKESEEFTAFQKNRIFKIPLGQYYH